MPSQVETIITSEDSVGIFWRELWEYRDLFYFLAWRDFKLRYKQTVIGVAWAVIRPLITMLVFTILFNHIIILADGIAEIHARSSWLGCRCFLSRQHWFPSAPVYGLPRSTSATEISAMLSHLSCNLAFMFPQLALVAT